MLQYYIIYYITGRPDIMKTNWKLPPFYDLTFLIFNNRKHPGKGVKDILTVYPSVRIWMLSMFFTESS